MANRVPASITGIGLVTPAGIGRAANWTSLCAGRPTAHAVDQLREAPVGFASTVPDIFDVDRLTGRRVSRHYDRSTQFALVAARAALSEARMTPAVIEDARVAVAIGTAFGGVQTFEANHARLMAAGPEAVNARFLPKGLVNMVSGILSIELGATGPNMVVSTACASGATAIGIGLGLLRSTMADVVVCGGTDASVTPLHVAGFNKLRALSRLARSTAITTGSSWPKVREFWCSNAKPTPPHAVCGRSPISSDTGPAPTRTTSRPPTPKGTAPRPRSTPRAATPGSPLTKSATSTRTPPRHPPGTQSKPA